MDVTENNVEYNLTIEKNNNVLVKSMGLINLLLVLALIYGDVTPQSGTLILFGGIVNLVNMERLRRGTTNSKLVKPLLLLNLIVISLLIYGNLSITAATLLIMVGVVNVCNMCMNDKKDKLNK